MLRFLWMMPRPPSLAIAIAIPASVTVSIAALSTGIFKLSLALICVSRDTVAGSTLECCGTSKTSSKV